MVLRTMVIALLACSPCVAQDVVRLTDGTEVPGKVVADWADEVVIQVREGETRTLKRFSRNQVASVVRDVAPAGRQEPTASAESHQQEPSGTSSVSSPSDHEAPSLDMEWRTRIEKTKKLSAALRNRNWSGETDFLVTRDGHRLEGRLISLQKKRWLVFRTADGTDHRLEWNDVREAAPSVLARVLYNPSLGPWPGPLFNLMEVHKLHVPDAPLIMALYLAEREHARSPDSSAYDILRVVKKTDDGNVAAFEALADYARTLDHGRPVAETLADITASCEGRERKIRACRLLRLGEDLLQDGNPDSAVVPLAVSVLLDSAPELGDRWWSGNFYNRDWRPLADPERLPPYTERSVQALVGLVAAECRREEPRADAMWTLAALGPAACSAVPALLKRVRTADVEDKRPALNYREVMTFACIGDKRALPALLQRGKELVASERDDDKVSPALVSNAISALGGHRNWQSFLVDNFTSALQAARKVDESKLAAPERRAWHSYLGKTYKSGSGEFATMAKAQATLVRPRQACRLLAALMHTDWRPAGADLRACCYSLATGQHYEDDLGTILAASRWKYPLGGDGDPGQAWDKASRDLGSGTRHQGQGHWNAERGWAALAAAYGPPEKADIEAAVRLMAEENFLRINALYFLGGWAATRPDHAGIIVPALFERLSDYDACWMSGENKDQPSYMWMHLRGMGFVEHSRWTLTRLCNSTRDDGSRRLLACGLLRALQSKEIHDVGNAARILQGAPEIAVPEIVARLKELSDDQRKLWWEFRPPSTSESSFGDGTYVRTYVTHNPGRAAPVLGRLVSAALEKTEDKALAIPEWWQGHSPSTVDAEFKAAQKPTPTPASGETNVLKLKNGDVVNGKIVVRLKDAVLVKLHDGTMKQIPVAELSEDNR